MIKNVIFDIGRVLIKYEPLEYLKTFGYENEKIKEINEAVFDNPLWIEFDRGTYTFAEGIEIIQNKNPHLKDDIPKILHDNWLDILEPINETVDFLKRVKDDGYKIYFLSNFSVEGFEYISKKYDFFSLCDGKVVSGYIKKIKPDDEIYHHLLDEYSLKPEECLFIDDSEKNIEAAKKLGFNAILFDGIETCIEQFQQQVNR